MDYGWHVTDVAFFDNVECTGKQLGWNLLKASESAEGYEYWNLNDAGTQGWWSKCLNCNAHQVDGTHGGAAYLEVTFHDKAAPKCARLQMREQGNRRYYPEEIGLLRG